MTKSLKQSNVFPFDYNFDKELLLRDYNRRVSKKQGYRYLAGKSYEDLITNESKAHYSKTTVYRVTAGPAYKIAKSFINEFGDYEFTCHYIAYDSNDFVEWHTDKRPEKFCTTDSARINIFLTGKSFTEFRDGKHLYENAVVNVMGAEHRYDNRSLGDRVMFQIAVRGISHNDLCENILQKRF